MTALGANKPTVSCPGVSVPEPGKTTEEASVWKIQIYEHSEVFIHLINSTDIYQALTMCYYI